MSNRHYLLVAAFLASAISFASTTRAQVSLDLPGMDNGSVSPQPLNDLKSALPYITWNGEKQGPFIAIAPEKVRWDVSLPDRRVKGSNVSNGGNVGEATAPHDEITTQPLYAPSNAFDLNGTHGLSADKVARHFSRRFVRLPTIAVFAPSTMYLLNTDLKPANPYSGGSKPELMHLLEATLTTSQWQLLGSPNGIGISDLNKDQQDIFDVLLPPTVTVTQETVRSIDSTGFTSDNLQSQTLTPEQRQGVRLRLDRKANLTLMGKKPGTAFGSAIGDDSVQVGDKRLSLSSSGSSNENLSNTFGQPVRVEVPNRLKPSDLDLKQPNLRDTYVPLTGVKTVNDLLKAVSAKTGLELYADSRLRGLSVYISSDRQKVRAADLLEAVCWSLTATYRKVGPVPDGDPKDFAYVLTYDRVGLTAQRGLIADWARRGGSALYAKKKMLSDAIQKQDPLQYLHFANGDAMQPTPEAEQALRDAQRDQIENEHLNVQPSIPMSTLSPTQRQQVFAAIQQMDEPSQTNFTWQNNRTERIHINLVGEPPQTTPPSQNVRTDRIQLREGVGMTYILPGIGEVKDGAFWSDDSTKSAADQALLGDAQKKRQAKYAQEREKEQTAALREPTAVSRVIVSIAPASAEEAQPLLAAAHDLGIDEVWVTTPGTSAGRAMLARCVAIGTAAGVRVGAKVQLIHDFTDDASLPLSAIDQNVFGETGSAWDAHIRRVLDGLDTRLMYGMFNVPEPEERRDSLAPESPATRERLRQNVTQTAAVPGLSCIVLSDAAAVGRDWSSAPTPANDSSWDGVRFGYTVANRLAFLRQNGSDPIDLAISANDYIFGAPNLRTATMLPRFDANSDGITQRYYGMNDDSATAAADATAWNAFLNESERDMLRAVRADIEKAQFVKPVYLASASADRGNSTNSGYARWQEGEPVPFAEAHSSPTAPSAQPPLRSQSSPPAVTAIPLDTLSSFPLGTMYGWTFAPDARKEAPNGLLGHPSAFENAAYSIHLQLKSVPDVTAPPGIVLDLAVLKPADALALLKGVLERLNLTRISATPHAGSG